MRSILATLPYRPVLRPVAQFATGYLLGIALGGPFALAGMALGEIGSRVIEHPQVLVAMR